MKIALIPNLTRKEAAGVTAGICKSLKALGADFCFTDEFKNEFEHTGARFLPEDEAINGCDAVIAVGGDGSIIHAAKLAAVRQKPILGINAGRLAFMAGLEDNELHLLSRLIEGDYTLDNRLMLKMNIKNGADVIGIASIFTYGMKKGLDRLAEAEVINHSLCDFDTIAEVAAQTGYIKDNDISRLIQFRNNPSDESWIGK